MWKKIGIVALFVAALGGLYWAYAIRPFLWISYASVRMPAVPLISECCGKILDLPYQEGSIVSRGAALCLLSSDLLEMKKVQAQSNLETARIQMNRQKASLDQAMQLYLSLRSDLELKKASQKAVDRQMVRLQEAQINFDEAKCLYVRAETELSYVMAQLGKTTLAAPEETLILQRCKQQGEIVKEGDVLYKLGNIHQAWVEAHLPESELCNVAVGNSVHIEMKAYPQQTWTGKIVSIGPTLLPLEHAPHEKMVILHISLDPNAMNLNLKEGMTACIRLQL